MSIGGSRSKAMPGGTQRRGPANCTGDARSLQIGSRRMLRPASCNRKLLCPIQVSVTVSGAALGAMKFDLPSGKDDGSGSGRRGFCRRSTRVHLRKSRNPWSWDEGHGFRNPPPGTWCEPRSASDAGGIGDPVIAIANDTPWTPLSGSARAGCSEIFFEMREGFHADECR